MINKAACLLALVLSLISFNAWAWDPPTAPHPPQSYITDVAHKLSATDLNNLNTKIRLVNRSTANEIAILIIPTLGDEIMSDVANLTFKAWGVGKKDLNNGVLIVIALKEHKARIEVGKSIEGDLTDSQSSEIIREKIFPHWKKGNLYAGLAAAVDAISSTVESRKDAGTPVPAPVPTPTAKPIPPSVPSTPNTPAQPSGCSYSAGSTSGVNMFTLLILCAAFYGLYRLIKFFVTPTRYDDDYVPVPPPAPRYSPPVRTYTPPPPPPEPVYVPTYPRYAAPHSTYHHTPTPAYIPPPPSAYVPPPPPPVYSPPARTYTPEPTVSETLGAVAGAAVVASVFDSIPDPEPAPRYETPSYDPPTPRYEAPSYDPPAPRYESDPSPSDDVGFGGGDSGGGGAEESWDDSSSSDSSSDDSGSSDSGSSDD